MNNKRPHVVIDEDYEPYNDPTAQQAKRQKLLESDAKETMIRKIEQIIRREFNVEIRNKEEEIELINKRLCQAKRMLDKLRAVIVTSYYGRVTQGAIRQQAAQIDQCQPTPIHPAVRKLLGKTVRHAPNAAAAFCSPASASVATASPASGASVSVASTIAAAADVSASSCDVVSVQPSRSCSPVPPAATGAVSAASSTVSSHGKDTRRVGRFKVLKKIIVGNVSKYLIAGKKDTSDPSTHKWMVYVRGPKDEPRIDNFVDKVIFMLHESYRPNDIVTIAQPPFHLTRRGWGEFPVRVQLHFKDGAAKSVDVIHKLTLDRTYSGAQALGSETAVEVELNISSVEPVDSVSTSNNPRTVNCCVPDINTPSTSVIKMEPSPDVPHDSVSYKNIFDERQNETASIADEFQRAGKAFQTERSGVRETDCINGIQIKTEPLDFDDGYTRSENPSVTAGCTESTDFGGFSGVESNDSGLCGSSQMEFVDGDFCTEETVVESVRAPLEECSVGCSGSETQFVQESTALSTSSSPSGTVENPCTDNDSGNPRLSVEDRRENCDDAVAQTCSCSLQDDLPSDAERRKVVLPWKATNGSQDSQSVTRDCELPDKTVNNLDENSADPKTSAVSQEDVKIGAGLASASTNTSLAASTCRQQSTTNNLSRSVLEEFVKCRDSMGRTLLLPKSLFPNLRQVSPAAVRTVGSARTAENSNSGISRASPTSNSSRSNRAVGPNEISPMTLPANQRVFVSPSGTVLSGASANPKLTALISGSTPRIVGLSGVRGSCSDGIIVLTPGQSTSGRQIASVPLSSRSGLQSNRIVRPSTVTGLIPNRIIVNPAVQNRSPAGSTSATSLPHIMVLPGSGKTATAVSVARVSPVSSPHLSTSVISTSLSAPFFLVLPNSSPSSSIPTSVPSGAKMVRVSSGTRLPLVGGTSNSTGISPGSVLIAGNAVRNAGVISSVRSVTSTIRSCLLPLLSAPSDTSTFSQPVQPNIRQVSVRTPKSAAPSTVFTTKIGKQTVIVDMGSVVSTGNSPTSSKSGIAVNSSSAMSAAVSQPSQLTGTNCLTSVNRVVMSTPKSCLAPVASLPQKSVVAVREKGLVLQRSFVDSFVAGKKLNSQQSRLDNYEYMEDLVRAIVKDFPLFQPSVDRSVHPYCAESWDAFLRWNIGKRRAAELCRAKMVRERVLAVLNGARSFHGEELWARRRVVLWCREHLYTPLDAEICRKFSSDDLSRHKPKPSSLTALEAVQREIDSATGDEHDINDDDIEIDVIHIDCDPAPVRTKRLSSPKVLSSPGVKEILPMSVEAQFVHETLDKFGVRTQPVPVDGFPDFLSPAVEEMLSQVLRQFVDETLRSSAAIMFNNDRNPLDMSADDVRQALVSTDKFDFLTCKYFGVPRVKDETGDGSDADN